MIAVVGGPTKGNRQLVAGLAALGYETVLVPGRAARPRLRAGDVAIGRLDVLHSLDGVEEGLLELLLLERAGQVRVLNGARALLDAHDKLRSWRLLDAAGLPVPGTRHVRTQSELRVCEPPLVVKPRFGSWGADVFRCLDRAELERCAVEVEGRRWFSRHGALVEELLPSPGWDLRLIVAGGEVVGGIERVAAPGEWRTNVALGGSRRRPNVPARARHLGVAAARAIDSELVGVDLLPVDGRWVVIELNGACDFDGTYSFPERDVYADIAASLELPRR